MKRDASAPTRHTNATCRKQKPVIEKVILSGGSPMNRVATIALIIAGSIGMAYAAAPELLAACCECCKDMLECCCGHKHS